MRVKTYALARICRRFVNTGVPRRGPLTPVTIVLKLLLEDLVDREEVADDVPTEARGSSKPDRTQERREVSESVHGVS